MSLTSFLKKEEQKRIVQAIGEAEKFTSGEIRVHVEPRCKCGNPLERALEVFRKLKMEETAQRNGVLIYVAYRSKHYAIIGDKGINDRVPANFWEVALSTLGEFLKAENQCEGICKVIGIIGDSLKEYFPYEDDDVNELSDEISYDEQD